MRRPLNQIRVSACIKKIWNAIKPLALVSRQNSTKSSRNTSPITYLLNAISYDFDRGQLLVSQRRVIVKLIPKKRRRTQSIINWGPITLLNSDYKIAAKATANHIKIKVLPELIKGDQLNGIC